jgi:DNA-binding MurR/RpiR family transcriptional regulator
MMAAPGHRQKRTEIAGIMERRETFDELKLQISSEHHRLSKRLRQIAEFAIAEPDQMALETVAAIGKRAKVQPSTLIRFAKHFGYDGFSDMQRVFRSRLIDRALTYSQRIRDAQAEGVAPTLTGEVLAHFAEADHAALQHLSAETPPADLDGAVELMGEAEIVGVIAQRRSFPIAAYLAYGLAHLGRRVHLIDGIGGMGAEQTRLLGPRDLLIAISYKPYAPETLEMVKAAVERGVKLVAITDTALSPLPPLAAVSFEVEEASLHGIRSLTATMCLAVTLVVGLGQKLAARPESAPPAAVAPANENGGRKAAGKKSAPRPRRRP